MDEYEVVVVGGSFAGLSAALQLARARRRILLIDAREPRNRFEAASYGFLGQDGVPPAQIVREGLTQLARYPTADFVHAKARSAAADASRFSLQLSDGQKAVGRKLILATGVTDELPLPSMVPRWGVCVLHCPYCHGDEVRDGQLAAPGAVRQALMLPDWGPTTYFTQGVFEPSEEEAVQLAARGVEIERTPVAELLGGGSGLRAPRLADGRETPADAVFTAPATRVSSPLAEQLGLRLRGREDRARLEVDPMQQTGVPGVFAAADAASQMYNATLASAAGLMAGVAAHRALVLEEAGGAPARP